MRVISRKRLRQFCEDNPELDAGNALDAGYRATRHASWANFAAVRALYQSVDQVDQFTVFNIAGHRLRLIAVIDFVHGVVYVREVLTHKDYDRGLWKTDKFGQRGWKPQEKVSEPNQAKPGRRPRRRKGGKP